MQQTYIHTTLVKASCEEVYDYYKTTAISPRYEGRDEISQITGANRPYDFVCHVIQGPFAPACYNYRFKKISDVQTEVTEHLTYTIPWGWLGTLFLVKKSERRMRRLIEYRHKVLQEDLKRISKDKHHLPLRVLVSGAHGLVGGHLKALLPLFRHEIFTLVRRPPIDSTEIYWDPDTQTVDKTLLERFDAVIHLSGENIGALRWTQKKKKAIYESRIRSTEFLAQCLNTLQSPPKTFLCASAIGFYGDCQGRAVDESGTQGEGFLAEVTSAWEERARLFTQGRVVVMRFGTVITLQGGFLSKWMPLFKRGCGAIFGTGAEEWSWISLEDLGYQILHLLRHTELQGAVNFTTPYPITSAECAHVLGSALHRSVRVRIRAECVKVLFGEMGQALFLNSAQVIPKKLEESHAVFAYPKFSETVNFYLGTFNQDSNFLEQ